MRVLVDTDPGLGLKLADVDDGLALFLMLNNPNFELEGITTVFGNTKVSQGLPLLKKYLKLADRQDIPHKLGAASRKDYGKLDEASQFLVDKVKENPDELTLITLGPLTNIATALKHYPLFFHKLKKIVIMGGTLTPLTAFYKLTQHIDRRFYDKIKNKAITAEFNFFNDPIATKMVMEAETKTPRIEMGLDICCKTVFKKEHYRMIKKVNKPIPQFITSHIKFWLNMWRLNGRGGFFPFDTFCPIYLLNPDLFKSANLFLEVDAAKVEGKLAVVPKGERNSAPITYCTDFTNEQARVEFMDILISNLIA